MQKTKNWGIKEEDTIDTSNLADVYFNLYSQPKKYFILFLHFIFFIFFFNCGKNKSCWSFEIDVRQNNENW